MKTVIITGASGNLGVTVTGKFLDSGYRVVATVINGHDQSALPAHDNLSASVVNLMNPEESKLFVLSCIKQYGQIHAVIMLAGGFAMGNIENTSASDISKMIALNFETAFNVAQPAYNHMKEHDYGRLVFIGARPALNATDGKSTMAYALSKSLLFKLSEQLNEDAKGTNIVSTLVVPSVIDTPVNRKNMPDENFEKWVRPAQLADIIEFICSEKADVIREPIVKVYNNS